MRIEISRAHHPVTVLGYGRRAGIWVQGCSIGCAGCIAHDTWEPDAGKAIDVSALLDWCRQLPDDGLDGVTISGGEPFDQPDALRELLTGLRPWADDRGLDLLCYSGRPLSLLRRRFGPILTLLDAVIPGRYVAARAPGNVWRGSANQQLVPLSALGRARYGADVDRPAGRNRLQATADGTTIRYIGVPLPGDLAAVDAALERRGLIPQERSWLT